MKTPDDLNSGLPFGIVITDADRAWFRAEMARIEEAERRAHLPVTEPDDLIGDSDR